MRLGNILSRLFVRLPGRQRRAITEYDAAFRRWQADNPGKGFSEFNYERARNRVMSGSGHPTLGKKLSGGRNFEESGTNEAQSLKDAGLQSHHVCVDYGCGSLRVGQHLIRYLEPENYYGMDLGDDFYRIGLEQIDEDLVRQKRPKLRVISSDSLEEVRRASPDYVFCNAVLVHVPPEDQHEFLCKVLSMFGPQTIGLVSALVGTETERVARQNWTYSQEHLSEAMAAAGGLLLDVRPKSNKYATDDGGHFDAWLVIRAQGKDEAKEANAS